MSQLPSFPPVAPGDIPDITFPLSTTVGALEIGVLLAVFLFGVLTVQVYIYFDRFPKDPMNIKLMVVLVWMLDFGHTIAISHLIYTITVVHYGQPALLVLPPRSLDVSILLSGMIGSLEEGWFTYRLYRFTKTLPLPLICVILSMGRLGGSTALFAVSLEDLPIQTYVNRVMWLIEAVVIVGAVVDVVLAFALCYYLSSWRTDGFRRTSKLVNQLMTWAIETGAITTTGALALLLTFLTMKDNFVYLGCFFILGKLFSNSLLFSLNARKRFARICAEVLSMPASMRDATQPISPRSVRAYRSSLSVEAPAHSPGDGPKRQYELGSRVSLSIRTDLGTPAYRELSGGRGRHLHELAAECAATP